jgi:hypothetical protein
MAKCGTCGHYDKPQKIRNYPNTDNEAEGWRTCAAGCTIRKDSTACVQHTDIQSGPPPDQKRRLIK